MQLQFTKMHGLVNDFMVVDNTRGEVNLSIEQIRQLADRHFGIGFDQWLMVEFAQTPGVNFRYIIFNADGSEVEQCGNGARCFARFVTQKQLTNNNPIRVETRGGLMVLTLNDDNSVSVNMGVPNFEPELVPLLNETQAQSYQIEGYEVGALSIGNPHCVLIVDQLDSMKIDLIAQTIQTSPKLPNQANIGFMQILSRDEIKLRVYERGAGETLACGSGAWAAVIHGVRSGLLNSTVTAHLSGGDAKIDYVEGSHVFLSGPAEFVFEGQIKI